MGGATLLLRMVKVFDGFSTDFQLILIYFDAKGLCWTVPMVATFAGEPFTV